MEFSVLVVAAAMIWTALSFLKHLRAGQVNDALTVLVLVGVGVGVAFLFRSAGIAAGFEVGGVAFSELDAASTVIAGYGFSSIARTGYELKKAVDNGDNACEPKLFPPSAGNPDA